MKKRLLAILLAGVMGSSMVATVQAEAGDAEIVIEWNPAWAAPADICAQYAEMYNEMQDGVKIELVENGADGSANYNEGVSLNVASNEPWEIFGMCATYYNKYVSSGVAYCVDDYVLNNEDVKDFAKAVVVKEDGHAYSFPATHDTFGLLVNVDMLEASGHTLEDLKTWEGMIQAAADVANANDNYGYLTHVSDFGQGFAEFIWCSNMWSAGADISCTIDGTTVVKNPEALAKAAISYRDLLNSDGGTTEMSGAIDYLYSGMAGMVVVGNLDLSKVKEQNLDFAWDWVPIPAVGEQSYSPIGGWTLMVNAKSEYAKESAEFLNWLYFETDFIADACTANFQISPIYSADAKLTEALADTDYTIMTGLIDSGAIALEGERPFSSQALEALGEMLTSVIFETTTDEEAKACVDEFIEKTGAIVEE